MRSPAFRTPGTVSRMSLVRPVGAVLLLLTVVAALSAALASLPAQAATVTVQVRDNAFRPDAVEIVAGDTVQWTWVGQGDHSVTFAGGSDSHPDCSGAAPENCSDPGDEPYVRTFRDPGEYSYFCRIHGVSDGMDGVVRVTAGTASPTPTETGGPGLPGDPEPSPSPSPEPSPTKAPAPDPTPDPPSPEPSPTATSEPPPPPPSSEPAPPPPPPPSSPPPQQLSPRPLPSFSPVPRPSPTEPEFDPFPSAAPDPDPTDDPADDEVAVPFPEGGDPDRSLLLAVASVAVLGTATTFGALVLFGPPWMGA